MPAAETRPSYKFNINKVFILPVLYDIFVGAYKLKISIQKSYKIFKG